MNNLKSTLLGTAFLIGMGMSANAADVYSRGSVKDTGPVDYRPAISWTGFYLGVHAGGAFGDEIEIDASLSNGEETLRDSESADVDNTWLAGVHLGYNWQTSGGLVLGVEGAWSVLGGERNVEVDGNDAGEIEDNWVASVRGRLGYAFGSTLVYGTGGVAFLNTDDADPFDDTLTGWVAGAGVEHKLRDNLSLGLEGLYYSFEDDVSESADGLRATADLERDFWTVQARITYHFGDRHGGESLK